jgi:hypothetical protein
VRLTGRTFGQAFVVDNRPETTGMIQALKAFVAWSEAEVATDPTNAAGVGQRDV